MTPEGNPLVPILEAAKGEHLTEFAERLTDLSCTTDQVELGVFNSITLISLPDDLAGDIVARWRASEAMRQIVITAARAGGDDVDAG